MKVLLLSLLVAAALSAPADPCAPHPNCQECVADTGHVCGWCSTPVVYKDGGKLGNHCVTNDGSHPFACYGLFSTEDCIRGYACDKSRYLCVLTDPGDGIPYDDCLQNCTNPNPVSPQPSPSPKPPADTYDCNRTDWKCFKTVPGKGTSYQLCLEGCHVPNPSSPTQPPPSPAPVYACNATKWDCYMTVPGKGASKEVCMEQCKPQPTPSPPGPGEKYACNFTSNECFKSNATNSTSLEQCHEVCVPLYYCDQTNQANPQCLVAPYPKPGIPKADCLTNCKPHNVTPSDLIGFWRGLQINTGFQVGEWQVDFAEDAVTIKFGQQVLHGSVSYVGPAPTITLLVTVRVSSFPNMPPDTKLSMIYAFDGASPELRYLMLASGKPNGTAPSDFHHALNATDGYDWTLATCQPMTSCKFALKAPAPPARVAAKKLKVDDVCMPLATCTECLAHPFCGWCSVDVIYKDGTPGKQCAGWTTNHSRNQFTCNGVFRTDDCNDYLCVEPEGVCQKVPLGGGESKEDCEKQCKPSPTPSPGPTPSPSPSASPAPTYDCNRTNFECFKTTPGKGSSLEICMEGCKKAPTPSPVSPVSPHPSPAQTWVCNTTDYTCIHAHPGSGTSKEICLAACQPPPPNPPPVVGTWRGLQVDNTYIVGEYQLDIDTKGYTLKLMGKTVQSGAVWQAEKVGHLNFKVDSGVHSGLTTRGFFTQSQGINVEHTLVSIGKDANDDPTGWDVPWIKGGANGGEYIWFQVTKA